MRLAASQPVCIYIVNSVPFPGPGPVRLIFRASRFPVPLPELGYTHCAEPTGGTRPGGTCQVLFVPRPELGLAHCAEPTGGTRPAGTCQSQFVPLPELSYAQCAEPTASVNQPVLKNI